MPPRCPTFQTRTPQRGACDGCGKPLPKRASRWCSRKCSDAYWDNHGWTQARYEARLRTLIGTGWRTTVGPFCDECGTETNAVEVNHVDPRNGAGYGEGCHNHQTNLQVLCHSCHVAETTRQIRERRGIPEQGRPRGVASPSLPMDSLWEMAS